MIDAAQVLHGNKDIPIQRQSVRTVLFDIHSHCEACHNSSEGIVVRSRVQRYICRETKE